MDSPDGLELLLVELLLGGGNEGLLLLLMDGGGRQGPALLLQGVELVDGLCLHRRCAVVVANAMAAALSADLCQPFRRFRDAEVAVHHLTIAGEQMKQEGGEGINIMEEAICIQVFGLFQIW